MIKPITLLLVIFIFFTALSFGQSSVSGTVSNNKNKPLAGVMVYLDTINSGIKSDKNGIFNVMVPENVKTIHVFSAKYGLLSTEYSGESKVDFVYIDGRLSAKERLSKNDKVSIGYNEVDKKYVAVKVEQVDGEERLDAVRFLTIYDLLRDRLPGVRVSNDNKITIRGVSSIISSQDPLFVVDGSVVSSIDNILPVDVDKVSVLKGAEASIYGTRGSNGVILIKTKN